ncbi:hypothetical protein ACFLQ7_00580 [Actinomycetota bacterium]
MNEVVLGQSTDHEIVFRGRSVLISDSLRDGDVGAWLSVYCSPPDPDSGVSVRFDLESLEWLKRELPQLIDAVGNGTEYEALLELPPDGPCGCHRTLELVDP